MQYRLCHEFLVLITQQPARSSQYTTTYRTEEMYIERCGYHKTLLFPERRCKIGCIIQQAHIQGPVHLFTGVLPVSSGVDGHLALHTFEVQSYSRKETIDCCRPEHGDQPVGVGTHNITNLK